MQSGLVKYFQHEGPNMLSLRYIQNQFTKHLIELYGLSGCISTLLFFSRLLVSNSLWPHELQHTRLPCPSLSPRVCSNPCPLSQWYYPTISSSVIPFSSCPQSFPASGSFQMSQLLTSGGLCIGASASASVLPMNILHWFPLGVTGFSLLSRGLSRVFLSTITNHKFWNQNCFLLSVESKGCWDTFFIFFNVYFITRVFAGGSVIKYPSANAGDVGLIPGLRRSLGVGNGNPLWYSCLWNSMDRVAWQATVHGVTKGSDTTWQLNNNFITKPQMNIFHEILFCLKLL